MTRSSVIFKFKKGAHLSIFITYKLFCKATWGEEAGKSRRFLYYQKRKRQFPLIACESRIFIVANIARSNNYVRCTNTNSKKRKQDVTNAAGSGFQLHNMATGYGNEQLAKIEATKWVTTTVRVHLRRIYELQEPLPMNYGVRGQHFGAAIHIS